jgi:hypothetical protein
MYLLIHVVSSPEICISVLVWSYFVFVVSLMWNRHITLTFVTRALHCIFSGTVVLKFLILEPVFRGPCRSQHEPSPAVPIVCLEPIEIPALQ